MVSLKGKESKSTLMATRILDENQASKNKENKIDLKLPRKIRSVASSAMITAQKSSNPNKGKIMGVENIAAKHGASVKGRTRRKALADVTNLSINGSNQCSNDSSNGLKLKKDKITGSATLLKDKAAKNSVCRPRISVTKRVVIGNISTIYKKTRSTNILASSKLKKDPIVKRKSNVEISFTKKQSEPNASTSFNDESVSSQGDGNSSSSDKVTVIISRSKRNRRKSYTSSLVAQSEILGEHKKHPINEDVRDIDDNTILLDVVEYVDDIYQYYWSMEVQNPLPANYMAVQSDITPRMRGILVNWLIEVHLKFHLMQETLFLMVQLLDRVLSVVPTKKDELQTVGLTTLLLASKYEDYWHPKINELVGLSANSFTRDQMLAMEKRLLKILRFRLNLPTPYVFMLRFLKAAESDNKLEQLAFYLVEICLGEYEALKYKPSLLCASAIYVARCTLNIAPVWTGLLRKHTCYNESQLRSCAEMILKYHRAACLQPTRITYEKYVSANRGRVAALAALEKLPVSI